MMTFYAAIGSYRIKTVDGHKQPYIQKLGKLHPISIPEFLIWSTLLWEVMSYKELKHEYDALIIKAGIKAPQFDELIELLVKRKLIARGVGYTGADALYNMLSGAFIIPFRMSSGKKLLKVISLLSKKKITVIDAYNLLKNDARTAEEIRVLDLVEQTPLSTSELIRCFDKQLTDVSTPEKVIAGIYTDDDSDQKHIANEQMKSPHTNAVLQAVSNLYLGRRIILELP
jgi:hypothetical protein